MINGVLGTPEVKARFTALGAQLVSTTNESFAADMKAEYEKAGALARRLGTVR